MQTTAHSHLRNIAPLSNTIETKGKRRRLPLALIKKLNLAKPGEPSARCPECRESYQMTFMVFATTAKAFGGQFYVCRLCIKEHANKYTKL